MPRLLAADLPERLFAGDRRAAARLISLVESGDAMARDIVRRIHARTGRAHVIGITGAPGAGKSTLVDGLADELRKRGLTVGIIAIDPTSPFTGGAFLGDRIRMQKRSTDKDVFIRSMGSRGSLGGLSHATSDAVKVLDAMGKDVILIETVGVGQAEIDIVKVADTTVVVLVPGMGDEIQSIKAGIMEIGDVFVVNKADRDGADKTVAEVEMVLMMGLGSEDPRTKAAREAEDDAHHRARGRAKGFLAADRTHAGEGTVARKALRDAVAPKKQADDERPSYFQELLTAGVWYPPVHKAIAQKGEGIPELVDYLLLHDGWLDSSGTRAHKRIARAERELVETMKGRLFREVEEREHLRARFQELVRDIAAREADPYTAADELIGHFKSTQRT